MDTVNLGRLNFFGDRLVLTDEQVSLFLAGALRREVVAPEFHIPYLHPPWFSGETGVYLPQDLFEKSFMIVSKCFDGFVRGWTQQVTSHIDLEASIETYTIEFKLGMYRAVPQESKRWRFSS